jgi:serine/threonine protein kinase
MDKEPTQSTLPMTDSTEPLTTQNHLVDGRFLIKGNLGSGGMGITYLAVDTKNDNRRVAIKSLRAHLLTKNNDWVKRHFRDEAKALSRIDHPGVVKLIAAGDMPDGNPYIAMEYVAGYDLRSLIEPEKGLKEFDRVARVMRQLCDAIGAAHDAGIYHRDLKPENILIEEPAGDDETERVKVIDFGIATVKDSLNERTKATLAAGTVRYMAPEQIKGRASAFSDIYALGIIAYELITGRTPFNPDASDLLLAASQLFDLQSAGVLVKPRDLRPSLPPAAQEIILKALSFQPLSRPARAELFGKELAEALLAQPESRLDNGQSLEMAYVLFIDIVSFSLLSLDSQKVYLEQLQNLVTNTPAFRQALINERLITLPRGDGFALAFFENPTAAVECATQIARKLQEHPHLSLRMGVHAGVVSRIADINANKDLAGGGINLAQRVMDSGDAGHILVSQNVADTLLQLSQWRQYVHDLGVHTVKHGAQLHLFNLYADDFGNPRLPTKLAPVDQQPSPDNRLLHQMKKFAFAALLVLASFALGFGIWQVFTKKPADQAKPATDLRLAPDRRERTLRFWVLAQKYVNKRPSGAPFKLFGSEMYFNSGDELQFYFASADPGYLYLLSPEQTAKGLQYNLLFPTPKANNASSSIGAGQTVATDRSFFDAKTGEEKAWILWSESPVAELESEIARWKDANYLGEIRDEATIKRISELLEKGAKAELQVEQDEPNKESIIKTREAIFARRLSLTHR